MRTGRLIYYFKQRPRGNEGHDHGRAHTTRCGMLKTNNTRSIRDPIKCVLVRQLIY